MKVGIVGASGFTGLELVKILSRHPYVDIALLTSETFVDQEINRVYPSLGRDLCHKLEPFHEEEAIRRCDIFFLALPHGLSSGFAAKAYSCGKVVIDLGADFRLRELEEYESWYKVEHNAPHLLDKAVYGLPELYRENIRGQRLIANPGCYPTSAILALAPLLKAKLIGAKGIIVDSKSGVSGAGRKASLVTHFNSVDENINPYGVAEHRHTPEIEQELSAAAGEKVCVTFTPQLVPINRGILSICYGELKNMAAEEEIRSLYEEFYKEHRFVELLPQGVWPHTKWVAGTNRCLLNFKIDARNQRIIVASVIDNLIKGASGQAVQNLNLIMGWPEETALEVSSVYP